MAQNVAQAYRQLSSQGANIVSLVIRCYDEIIASLYATVRAIERHDIEEKTDQLNRPQRSSATCGPLSILRRAAKRPSILTVSMPWRSVRSFERARRFPLKFCAHLRQTLLKCETLGSRWKRLEAPTHHPRRPKTFLLPILRMFQVSIHLAARAGAPDAG